MATNSDPTPSSLGIDDATLTVLSSPHHQSSMLYYPRLKTLIPENSLCELTESLYNHGVNRVDLCPRLSMYVHYSDV